MGHSPMSRIGIGTMNFGVRTESSTAFKILEKALDKGITLINTADVDYSGRSEKLVGEFIAAHGCRSQLYLSVEIADINLGVPNAPKLDAEHLIPAANNSLSRLGVDYVDRFFLPRPNMKIPIERTLAAVNILVEQGACKDIGVSTFPAWLTAKAIMAARMDGKLARVAGELSPYNLLDRRCENARLPMVRNFEIDFFAWAPLGQGLLAGRYDQMAHDGDSLPIHSRAAVLGGLYKQRVSAKAIEVARAFVQLAKSHGMTPANAAVKWCLSTEGVTAVIVGPRTLEQMAEISEVGKVNPAPDFFYLCDTLVPPGTACADFHNSAPWMLESVQSR